MDRTTSLTITGVLLLLALLGMFLGWRARRRRQSALPAPLPVPAEIGAALFSVETLYAATTIAGEPLNRVAVRGLGFRGRATVTVVPSGVILGIAGTPEIYIPSTDIRSVERATWTIDRVVEAGGLVCIAWTLGAGGAEARDIDSYFRVTESTDPVPLIRAIQGILVKAAS
ncbi:MAG: hypothetical protein JWN80_1435 [Microbacteriaceae bacterium]|nr:hypothetical protein [Microbacteriaceae bacterium]